MPQETPRLPFEIDDAIDPTLVTGWAGFPLVIKLFRQLGVAQANATHVAVKLRQRGLPPSALVESLITLWVRGGDRYQDLTMLREDHALATLLGHPLATATTVRDFLEAFHAEAAPIPAVQHQRESDRACPTDPPPALPGGPTRLTGPGAPQDRPIGSSLAGGSCAQGSCARVASLCIGVLCCAPLVPLTTCRSTYPSRCLR